VDGKSVRGSRTETAPAAHLLSAVTAAGRTVSQLRMPDRTNEITAFTALLDPFDLTGTVVTADGMCGAYRGKSRHRHHPPGGPVNAGTDGGAAQNGAKHDSDRGERE
jgi:hypothetical protein